MKKHKLWPFGQVIAILSAVILPIVLLLLLSQTGWLAGGVSNQILIGIVALSLLPILLSIFDAIIDKGVTIGYGDFKLDFSKVQQTGTAGFSVPVNIGIRGEPVYDSGTNNILEALQDATTSSTVIIDLGDGHAWWETRLLVLLAGAVRLNKPDKIVFIGKEGGRDHCFQGWGVPSDLLTCLLKDNQVYLKSYLASRAITRQWELMPPLELVPTSSYYQIPPLKPNWMLENIHSEYGNKAFSGSTGLPNEFLAEQILQNDLGKLIESLLGSKHLSIARLQELFGSVLIKQNIDLNWPLDQQQSAFLANDHSWIALTNLGQYTNLVSRLSVINELMRSLLDQKSQG